MAAETTRLVWEVKTGTLNPGRQVERIGATVWRDGPFRNGEYRCPGSKTTLIGESWFPICVRLVEKIGTHCGRLILRLKTLQESSGRRNPKTVVEFSPASMRVNEQAMSLSTI